MSLSMERLMLAQERLHGPAKRRKQIEQRKTMREWKRQQKLLARKKAERELSEHELVTLDAVRWTLDGVNESEVAFKYVRQMSSSQPKTHNGLTTRVVNLKFGYRSVVTDSGGSGRAIVRLRQVLVSDTVQLAHNYLVWAPESVTLFIENGSTSIHSQRFVQQTDLGNAMWRWNCHVEWRP